MDHWFPDRYVIRKPFICFFLTVIKLFTAQYPLSTSSYSEDREMPSYFLPTSLLSL